MSSTPVTLAGRELSFTCHSGLLAGRGLPNSLEGVRECLEAVASRIEIDIHSMAADDYLVSHASRLEESTTSHGPVGRLTRDQALTLRRSDDRDSRPPLLSEIVALVLPYASELQLDLKDWRPMPSERVCTLIALIEPLGDRALVSSGQDWNLRAIASQTDTLRLGFDPDHYIAAGPREAPVPTRLGAYGYRDDHPLALGRAQPVAEYLRGRMNDLMSLCPFASELFIEYSLLLQAAGAGVSLPGILHERGVTVSAWTLDHDAPESMAKLTALANAGVDRVTTNTTQQFVAALSA